MIRASIRTISAIIAALIFLVAPLAANAKTPESIERDTALFFSVDKALEMTRKLGSHGRTAYIDKRALGGRHIYVIVEIYKPKTPDEHAPNPATLPKTEGENEQTLLIAATLSNRAVAKKAIKQMSAEGINAFIIETSKGATPGYSIVVIPRAVPPTVAPPEAPIEADSTKETGKQVGLVPVETSAPTPVAPAVASIEADSLKKLKKDIDIFLNRENALRLVGDLGAKDRNVHIENRYVGAGEMYVVVEIYTSKTPKKHPPQPDTLPDRGHVVVATLTSKEAAVNALKRLKLRGVEAHVIVTHKGGAPAYSFVVNPRVATSLLEPRTLELAKIKPSPPPQQEGSPKRISFEYEINPYYTNADLFLSLTNAPIPDAGEKSELEIYRDLFLGSYIPRFMVLEVSVYPMPLAGVALKKRSPEFYSKADMGDDLNLFQAVTEGFEEPWAVSLFLGNVMNFKRSGSPEFEGGNKGFMGYLFSAGNLHIKDNVLINDDWLEVEWKIKGDRDYPKLNLSWSFRIGAKFHNHEEITDVYYVAVRRSRLDFEAQSSSIRHNSAFEYTFLFDQKHMSAVQHEFSVEKKFPQKGKKYAFTLALGVIYDKDRKYTGLLDDRDGDSYSIIIRPNIEF